MKKGKKLKRKKNDVILNINICSKTQIIHLVIVCVAKNMNINRELFEALSPRLRISDDD